MSLAPSNLKRVFAATAGVLLLLLAAFGAQAQDVKIKLLVNDDPISDYDIAQRERFLQLTAKAQPGPELTKKTTEMLITEHLQLQEGRKLGITPSDAEVTRVLDGMASQNNLDAAGLTTALARSGVNIRTLKNRISAQMVWQRVVQQKFRREVNVNDAQIDEALAETGGGSSSGASSNCASPSPMAPTKRPSRPEWRKPRTYGPSFGAAAAFRPSPKAYRAPPSVTSRSRTPRRSDLPRASWSATPR